MSYITDVLIQDAPKKVIDELNTWLLEHDERKQQLQPINMDAAGGTKYYVTDVWAAAFNYGPMGDFLPKLRDPQTWGSSILLVSVFINQEGDREAFVFDKVDGEYQPTVSQEARY